jgi:hypothetical protein
MGHPSSDAVLDFLRVWPDGLQFRIGLKFRLPDQPPEATAPERHVRIQVASPPPMRHGGKQWFEGLRVDDSKGGRPFNPADEEARTAVVFPLDGIRPLREPPEGTLICNEEIVVPLVASSAARAATFTLMRSREPVVGQANHFLSVPYPPRMINGVELRVAGADYQAEGVLHFTQRAGPWIAVSLDEFKPDNRESADYIAPVDEG